MQPRTARRLRVIKGVVVMVAKLLPTRDCFQGKNKTIRFFIESFSLVKKVDKRNGTNKDGETDEEE
jgi:hypothetical protein